MIAQDSKPSRQRLRIKAVRLCKQAHQQGGLLSSSGLSELLGFDAWTIPHVWVQHEKQTGHLVPRRATLHDVGTGLTHKRIICGKGYAQGKPADVVAREAYHSLEAGERATEEPQGKQAIAFTNLATSCVESGRYEEAVTAARSGRACWRQHDVGDVSAARADLKLGNALLRQGEALHGRGDPLAQPVLDEALEWLSTAHEALLAYGSTAAGDAQSCLDLKDFGERLRASLELGPPA